MDLKAEQEKMRRRWLRLDGEPDGKKRRQPRKRGVVPVDPHTLENAQREQEKAEIAELAAKTNLLCPGCNHTPVTASKRTGEIRLCGKCKYRRYLRQLQER